MSDIRRKNLVKNYTYLVLEVLVLLLHLLVHRLHLGELGLFLESALFGRLSVLK